MVDLRFKKTLLLYFSILGITLLFVSYGAVGVFNAKLNQGFMRNFYEMWMPSFNMLPVYWNYILFLPYILFLFYFIRNVDVKSFEFLITITFTIVYCLIYAQPRFREPLMPILILWLSKRIENEKK